VHYRTLSAFRLHRSQLASARSKLGEPADVGEIVKAGDRFAQLAGPRRAQHRLDQRVEFGREAAALIGDVGGGNAGVVPGREVDLLRLTLDKPSISGR
jgi:hypothetical protein